ncbi:MAG: 30S ribosomal protein S9 [Elusimicrobiota bacterium]|jgi:small subunit ribosomal protein S9|nr:30S ribosomal protein S9 [Elusimicrobiota bacterium]
MSNAKYFQVGRRKNAVARAQVIEGGKGTITVNDRTFDDYFKGLERHKQTALKPLTFWTSSKDYDFYINVYGGGISGQAGAISHCLARTILELDESLRAVLKKEGLLTRDSRMVERKKPGRPKARKRFQYSKR